MGIDADALLGVNVRAKAITTVKMIFFKHVFDPFLVPKIKSDREIFINVEQTPLKK